MPEEEEAYNLISWVRGCTFQEARRLCSRIQEMPTSGDSSFWDIADAVLILESSEDSPEDKAIAQLARKMPCPGKRRVETVAEDPEVLCFEGALAHKEFLDWIDRYEHGGFVLNVRSQERNPVMHTARCSHLRPDPRTDRKSTSSKKLCSTGKQALRGKAAKYSLRLELCTHCDI